jgi:hypothetical protein
LVETHEEFFVMDFFDFLRKPRTVAALACVSIFSNAYAQTNATACNAESGASVPTIVELYTSEGCNSCPPADRWLSQLITSGAPNVIPLAFHVDYWDYIGWKDVYAKPAYGERHSALVRANGSTTVYTPQVFVNGRDDRSWRVRSAQFAATPSRARMTVEADWKDGALELRGKVLEGQVARIRYVVAQNGIATDVKRGENAGETLKQDAVVRDHAIANLASDKSFSYRTKLANDVKRDRSVLYVIAENAVGDALAAVSLKCSVAAR